MRRLGLEHLTIRTSFRLFQFGKILTLHQRALVVVATSERHLLNQKMNWE